MSNNTEGLEYTEAANKRFFAYCVVCGSKLIDEVEKLQGCCTDCLNDASLKPEDFIYKPTTKSIL